MSSSRQAASSSMSKAGRDSDEHRIVKKRRRSYLNCAECRRLKLKCDRKIPCANCVQRSCADLCPDAARSATKKPDAVPEAVRKHIESLEAMLFEQGIQPPAAPSTELERQSLEKDESQHRSPSVNKAATPAGSSRYHEFTPYHTSAERTMPGMLPQPPSLDPWPILPPIRPIPPPVAPPGVSLTHPMSTNSPTTAQSHGTLVISHSGQSKYLGPSAASEWLRDQEVFESSEPTGFSRQTSPSAAEALFNLSQSATSFPFATKSSKLPSVRDLVRALPLEDDARAMVDSYFRYFCWSYELISRDGLRELLDQAYTPTTGPPIHVQSLALLYMIFALGSLHQLELAPDDPTAEEYLNLAKICLVKGDFMAHNTIAGVQTLNVMAHYHLETDRGRNGDSAWPLWGLAMRIVQAMGLHRDGERWNLPESVIEERRRVFWETHCAEILQANCFSRPCSLGPEFVDTKFPAFEPAGSSYMYHTMKYELCQLSKEVLYALLTVDPTMYDGIVSLYQRICALESRVPYDLRCRAAMVALPSRYPEPGAAEADTPPVNRRDLRKTFEQHCMAEMISETIINLFRPYFLLAIQECPKDPTRSVYAQPFLSVLERSNVIIQIVCNLYALHPVVTARNWWCWYHAFNSAVCMGTLIIMSPHTDFASIALRQMDQVVTIYTSIVQSRTSPRFVQNLQWLLRLRQKAIERMALIPDLSNKNTARDEETELDAGLLGWRTRLIERVGQGSQRATTITGTLQTGTLTSPTVNTELDGVIRSIPQAVQNHVTSGVPTVSSANEIPASATTDQFLHQFWEPMLISYDAERSPQANWWDLLAQQPQPL